MSGQQYSGLDRIFGSSNNELPYGFTPSPHNDPSRAYNYAASNPITFNSPSLFVDHNSRASNGNFNWQDQVNNPSKYI